MEEAQRREKFRVLYEAAYPRVLGYALRRTPTPEDAADLVAETFLTAWRRFEELPPGDEAQLWLYGVAHRQLANHRRGEQRRSALSERLVGELEALAREHRPKMIVVGASAYPRTLDFARFREIADTVGAYLMADMAHIAGLVAAGLHPSPVPYADVVTSTTHKTLRGPRAAIILCRQELAKTIDKAVFPGIQAGPLMHTIAAKAVMFKEAMSPEFKAYQQQIIRNAKALADTLLSRGFRLVSGGTDNHLMLVDLRGQNLTGRMGANILREANIITNFNTIPFDPQPPTQGSGIRPGSPCLTTRGMKEVEMAQVGNFMAEILLDAENAGKREAIKEEVTALCRRFPLYEYLTAENPVS